MRYSTEVYVVLEMEHVVPSKRTSLSCLLAAV